MIDFLIIVFSHQKLAGSEPALGCGEGLMTAMISLQAKSFTNVGGVGADQILTAIQVTLYESLYFSIISLSVFTSPHSSQPGSVQGVQRGRVGEAGGEGGREAAQGRGREGS